MTTALASITTSAFLGKITYTIPRNDVLKTPEIVFKNMPLAIVEGIARGLDSMTSGSTWDIAFEHQYDATGAGPVTINGIVGPTKDNSIGLTEGDDHGVNQVHVNDTRGYGNGITFEQQLVSPSITVSTDAFTEGSTVGWTGLKASELGFLTATTATTFAVFDELSHVLVREDTMFLGGHGEVVSGYLDGSKPFNGLTAADIYRSDNDFMASAWPAWLVYLA